MTDITQISGISCFLAVTTFLTNRFWDICEIKSHPGHLFRRTAICEINLRPRGKSIHWCIVPTQTDRLHVDGRHLIRGKFEIPHEGTQSPFGISGWGFHPEDYLSPSSRFLCSYHQSTVYRPASSDSSPPTVSSKDPGATSDLPNLWACIQINLISDVPRLLRVQSTSEITTLLNPIVGDLKRPPKLCGESRGATMAGPTIPKDLYWHETPDDRIHLYAVGSDGGYLYQYPTDFDETQHNIVPPLPPGFQSRLVTSADLATGGPRALSPSPGGGSSRSASRSRRRERTKSPGGQGSLKSKKCRNYERSGFCVQGIMCKFYHDYNRPLTIQAMRVMMDGVAGSLFQIRKNQEEIAGRIAKAEKSQTRTVQELIRKMSELSISPRDISMKARQSRNPSDLKTRMGNYHF